MNAMTLECASCHALITEYDDDIYCRLNGAEYRFCCERCARDWINDNQDELNDYLYNVSGLFEVEVAPKERRSY